MTHRVLITDHPFPGLVPEQEILGPLGVELQLAASTDAAELAALADGAIGILVCYAQVPRSVLCAAAAGGCRIVSRYGIGYDNVDVTAATELGIVVTTVPDYCLDEVADHTMALLLASARSVTTSANAVTAGGWSLPSRPVHRLAGRQLTLVGCGAIGERVAQRARAFGLRVVVYDPYANRERGPEIEWADTLSEAVSAADYISVHAPLTEETRHIIGRDSLAATTRSPVLVNTSRGSLVDLDALGHALADGTISAAALDVTEPEPLPEDHPLRQNPDVIVTPHIAFHSEEAQTELQRRAAGEVARAIRGLPPEHPRNPDIGLRLAAEPQA
jgi:D-3-phosphoglycerate dehydrogenase